MNIPVIFLIIIIISFYFIFNKIINRTDRRTLYDTDAEHINKWGNIIIGFIGGTALLFINLKFPDSPWIKWFWIIFLIVILGFNFVLEWKYLKGSKKYIATLLTLLVGIVIFYFLF